MSAVLCDMTSIKNKIEKVKKKLQRLSTLVPVMSRRIIDIHISKVFSKLTRMIKLTN